MVCFGASITPSLLKPEKDQVVVANPPDLHWQTDNSFVHYHLQVSVERDFATTIINDSTLIAGEFSSLPILTLKKHYWRVRGQTNKKKWSQWSKIYAFTVKVGVIGLTEECNAHDCVVLDSLVLVASGGDCRTVDVSNPENPKVIRRRTMPSHKITYTNGYTYTIGSIPTLIGTYLTIMDVSDPLSPTVHGQLSVRYFFRDLVSAEQYCYVTCPESGLVVVDVADVENPYILSRLHTDRYYGLDKKDDYLLIAVGSEGIVIIDISDPKNPNISGKYKTMNHASDIAIYDTIAYIADQYFVHIINIAQIPAIDSICTFQPISGFARSISVLKNMLCVSTDKTVEIYDVSNVSKPKFIGYIRTVPWKTGMQSYHSPILIAAEDVAYLCAGEKGLMIIKIRH